MHNIPAATVIPFPLSRVVRFPEPPNGNTTAWWACRWLEAAQARDARYR